MLKYFLLFQFTFEPLWFWFILSKALGSSSIFFSRFARGGMPKEKRDQHFHSCFRGFVSTQRSKNVDAWHYMLFFWYSRNKRNCSWSRWQWSHFTELWVWWDVSGLQIHLVQELWTNWWWLSISHWHQGWKVRQVNNDNSIILWNTRNGYAAFFWTLPRSHLHFILFSPAVYIIWNGISAWLYKNCR